MYTIVLLYIFFNPSKKILQEFYNRNIILLKPQLVHIPIKLNLYYNTIIIATFLADF